MTSGRSVAISSALVGQGSEATAKVGQFVTVARRSAHHGANRRILIDELSDIATFHGRDVVERDSAKDSPWSEGLVRLAFRLRWGTEPEGWYVDLPSAVLIPA